MNIAKTNVNKLTDAQNLQIMFKLIPKYCSLNIN